MYLKLILLFSLSLTNLFFSQSIADTPNSVKKHNAADWVIYHRAKSPRKTPVDKIKGGVYYLLVDNQIHVRNNKQPEFYSHYAELIVNQQGLESSSQINIKFDPTYQALTLNSLMILRNNKTINKISKARISHIQQETELENLIYNGRITANIILDDVRVGDIVEYSYTLTGINPVYNNIFSYQRLIEWSVPVHQQKLRILWGKPAPLYVNSVNTKNKPTETVHKNYREYTLDINDAKPVSINSETPEWYDPYGIIFFSELENWSDVARWALPLYTNAIETSPEVKKISRDISSKYKNKSQQIVQALKLVQNDIRYLGIETGTNSHNPSAANQTLQRRYGDCKDKSVLLISLLKSLGIKARPALVNTQTTGYLTEQPPMINAFNHVLVKVWHDNKVYWLDPTSQYQNDQLSSIHQPDYHSALVIDTNIKELQRMNDNPANSRIIVDQLFDLTKGGGEDAVLEINTRYFGYNAEKLRYRIASQGLSSIQENYLEFYRDYYTAVEPLQTLVITESGTDGSILQKEKYLLKKFWQFNEKDKSFGASFYADTIFSTLPKPKQLKRNAPYSLAYPNNIKQNIKIKFGSAGWSFDDEKTVQDTPYFYYKYTSTFNKNKKILDLNHEFRTLVDHVATPDFDTFLTSRKLVRNFAEFGIIEYSDSDSASASTQEDTVINTTETLTYSAVAVYIIGLLFIFVNWRIDAEQQPTFENMTFYPVSMVKFLALSFFSIGIYPAYWFYRNWKYSKDIDNNATMPTARAIFNIFWYYPLYNRLTKDSANRYQENRVLIKPLAIFFAILYFTFGLLESTDNLWLSTLIILPLLLIPLVNYINHINTANSDAYSYNSRWLFRHTLLAIFFLPLIIYSTGTTLNLLPSDKVVTGETLFDRDIKFLHRKGVFPSNEKIIYFYSDALLNTLEDGNGFTDKHVFSYWNDDDNGFQFENEALKNVKKIDTDFSKDLTENTIITITRNDGSEFLLYISRTDGLDKKFVNSLKNRWNESRKTQIKP